MSVTWDGTKEALFRDYFDLKLKFNPIIGSRRGYHKYDDRVPPHTPTCFKMLAESCKEYQKRAAMALSFPITRNSDPIDPLKELELIHLLLEANACHRGIKAEGYYFPPVHYIRGIQSFLVEQWVLDGLFEYKTVDDLQNPLKRLKAIPAYIDDIINTLKEGASKNMTFAPESFHKTKEQFAALQVSKPEESNFYVPFEKMSATLFDRDSIRGIQNEAKKVIEAEVLPAYNRLDEYIHNEYFLHLRPTPGVLSLPNGQSYYKDCLEFFTSLSSLTADQIHEIGLAEVAELTEKVSVLMTEFNMTGRSLSEFSDFVRSQPGQTFESKNELLEYVKDILDNKINPILSQIIPEELLTSEIYQPNIAPVPPGGGGSVYFLSGAVDGSRPGTFYINLHNLSGIKKFELLSLTLHEANPGHNLDDVVKSNLGMPDYAAVPIYSRLSQGPSNFPFQTALNEGWALYVEHLGLELGLYEDPFDLIGYYSYNLLRAARLVVDTGIHAKGWTKERAVEYLVNNTFFHRKWAEGQVNRYITWPGQAVSYKMGERAILQLRRIFEEQRGSDFDLKEFHGYILSCQVHLPWLKNPLENALAGSVAAIFASVTLCPTEHIKCQLQAQREMGQVHRSTFSLTREIIRQEGFGQLFKGLGPTLAREIPGCFFFFLGNEGSKAIICRLTKSKREDLGLSSTLFCGGVAGVSFWTSIFPFDAVKSRIQVSSETSAMRVARELWITNGIRAFYSGLLPCALRAFPSSAAMFLAYEYTKDLMTFYCA
eukprot:TCALIF_04952-PA protein Name:"Similar to Slc25a15 Mitochondrial ornithine transporter 1 (Mus musculus)" AED:0.50 eAED:0.50 QI:0/0/0/0.33/1/1/3/0/767